MGDEITQSDFSQEDFKQFEHHLRKETHLLSKWFDQRQFVNDNYKCGLELEAWIVDENFLPSPTNQQLMNKVQSELVSLELSQFNIEFNSTPMDLNGSLLSDINSELTSTWSRCHQCASDMDAKLMMIGILPTVRQEMLTMDYVSSLQRYYALNRQVQKLRKGQSCKFKIEGYDELAVEQDDIMLEAAATSLQIHLQVPLEEAVRYYNACHIASSIMVALGANSPFMFGKSLWDETRIAVFEESVRIASFRNRDGDEVGRVTFGSGYAKDSMMEPFLENLDGYPVLLPEVFDADAEQLRSLRLHNGTIWRWNRPLIGFCEETQKPSLRIEHRVTSSGPTIPDIVANIAFFLGLVRYLANLAIAPEIDLPFATAKENFYQAAKKGLDARVTWVDGKEYDTQSLILNTLIDKVKDHLEVMGIAKKDIEYYIDDIIKHRALSGRNGAAWQKAYIDTHGSDFQAMTKAYYQQQQEAIPVHEWTV